jgi:acyl dehydratase
MTAEPAPPVTLGRRVGPFAHCLDRALLRRYADATRDASAVVRTGQVVPPAAIVTSIWNAQNSAREELVSPELQQRAAGGVHGEHDILLHRPIVPGETLQIWVDGWGARPAGRNSRVTLRYVALDAREQIVAEQWWTTVFLGVTCEPVGSAPPDHSFPEPARDRPLGTWTADVDDDMARQYAEVSGDWSPHHFDPAAARRSGFDRVFLHGLCTMALCAQGVVQVVADGDPERVRRIAVRFASPTFLGERLTVNVFDAGPLGYAFEADSADARVISNGRVELR